VGDYQISETTSLARDYFDNNDISTEPGSKCAQAAQQRHALQQRVSIPVQIHKGETEKFIARRSRFWLREPKWLYLL
jgi:hypothetical protein